MESLVLLDQWLVRPTRQLVNLAENLICRGGARLSAAEAEGFSLLQQRCAALLGENAMANSTRPSMNSTLVYHREKHLSEPLEFRLAFELQASSAQDAVYHCIIAHDVTAKLGQPGLCSIDDELADTFCGARMPSQKLIDAITPIAHNGDTPILNDDLIVQTIANTFHFFSQHFNLDLAILSSSSLKPNGFCLVSSGRFTKLARNIADHLGKSGIHIGVLDIALLKPFPWELVANALASQRKIIILGTHNTAELSPIMLGMHEIRSHHRPIANPVYIPMISPDALKILAQSLELPEDTLQKAIPPSPSSSPRPIVIGAAPGGDMSLGFLLDLASYLSQTNGFTPFDVKSPHPLVRTLGFDAAKNAPKNTPILPVDILFLSHPGLVDIPDILNGLAQGGCILILGRSVEDTAIWPSFRPDMQKFIEQHQIALYMLSGSLLGEYRTVDRYGAYVVHGAILELLERVTHTPIPTEILAKQLSPSAMERLKLGRDSLREVDRSIDRAHPFDPYFAPQIQLPKMLPAHRKQGADWRSSMRNFFVRGQSSDAVNHPLPGLSIRPAALNPYLQTLENEHYYPLLVTRIAGDPSLHAVRLDTALREHLGTNNNATETAPWLRRFVDTATEIADASLHITPAKTLLNQTLEAMTDADHADAAPLLDALRNFIANLTDDCHLVGLNPHTLLDLYVLSVRAARQSRIRDIRADIKGLITQLRDALLIDDANGPLSTQPDALDDAFGPAADVLLDTTAIAHDLQHQTHGHKPHNPERDTRMYHALKTLEAFLETLKNSDDLIFAYAPDIQVKSTYDRVRTICHSEPIAVASGLFDAISQHHIEAFKAMRVARLDIDNAFDPEYHTGILDHFTWQDLSEDELRLLPVICIAETASRLYEQLSPLSRLIRQGKPLDVLVFESTSNTMHASQNAESDTSQYNPGFSYLATAYREAFISQSTLARPEHLVATLTRMNRLLRPAITVVACPTWTWRVPPRVQLEAAHYGRIAPVFQYDPSLGQTRIERFNVEGNPQIDTPWPVCAFSYLDENGQTKEMTSEFTFAHALALEPGYHKYFRILPNEAWNDELVEIGEFLKNPTFDKPRIPYIWGVVDSIMRKCIMTREVANACIDRMQRWTTLRELALSTQAQIKLAADLHENAHAQILQQTQQELESTSAQLDESQHLIASTAKTLDACLQSMKAFLNTGPNPPSKNATERQSCPECRTPSLPDEDPNDMNASSRDEISFIEGMASMHLPITPAPPLPVPSLPVPRVESNRCMSCGACVSLNDKLFGFDDDGHAILIDPNATTEQCQEAADLCPAGCIVIG